jgi:amino acid transporter
MSDQKPPLSQRLRWLFIGDPRSPYDQNVFHRLSLIAFFAWVGLGADGLSSSCYGPEEAFLALGKHGSLSIFVGLATAVTIFIISASYSQIIELFPTGGGGYLVASKLLSHKTGMVAGCALLVDYVLTIALSVASGADAIFSFLPVAWQNYKLPFAVLALLLLIFMNLRGVKESVLPLVPIFMLFLVTHAFAILYALISHGLEFNQVAVRIAGEVSQTQAEIGVFGMLLLIMRAYSMGAGTFTGIEAVSNGMSILREPKVHTARKTMAYMAISLAVTVVGLMLAYILYSVVATPGKTINAVLFENMVSTWPTGLGQGFVLVILASEAAILFVAAQTGFLGGPGILANMALDRWLPTRFSNLSDRLVTQNGILIMGLAALVVMVSSRGSVHYLVVLYSINVFITFSLSQLGMVRHWWRARGPRWIRKLTINGIGLSLTLFILMSVVILKFFEGGWITLIITGSLIWIAVSVKKHYLNVAQMLKKLDVLVDAAAVDTAFPVNPSGVRKTEPGPDARTAVILVNGYNGVGLHTLFNIFRTMGDVIGNYVFVQVGIVDAGNFKGTEEVESLKAHVRQQNQKYVSLMERHGYKAEGVELLAVDVVDEIAKFMPELRTRYPNAIFFGGQLVFPQDNLANRLLHNYITFSIQRRLFSEGIPFVIVPIRL